MEPHCTELLVVPACPPTTDYIQGVGRQYAILISVSDSRTKREMWSLLTTTGRHLWILSARRSSQPLAENMFVVSLDSSAHSLHIAGMAVVVLLQLHFVSHRTTHYGATGWGWGTLGLSLLPPNSGFYNSQISNNYSPIMSWHLSVNCRLFVVYYCVLPLCRTMFYKNSN